ncbi:hypothetical protein RhiirB3_430336 [Rhizophagus irregularis]|nr:hypothetical protein RhiirB3_430336 [Rhizophagus irregularis]
MQNSYPEYSEYSEYPEYPEYHPLEVTNDPPYENESVTLLTHPSLTQRAISQQNNNFSMHQNLQILSNSIDAFEENINRQLEQFLLVHQLFVMLRQLTVMNVLLILPNNSLSPNILHCQQTNVPTETIDNEIFS